MAIKFRHEYKFALGFGEYLSLRSRLRAVLPHDPHAGPTGEYLIRSVYFDNPNDKALREKLNGVNVREKFRIRWYNGDTSYIKLEKKSKQNGLGSKTSCLLTADELTKIFHGDTAWMKTSDRKLAVELAVKMELEGLRPRTVVDYRREPFVFPAGNVRVTLDRDIRGAEFCPDMQEYGVCTVPTVENALLEVKYDEFLPDIIRDVVQLDSRGAGAFSKYAACRGYY